MLSELSQTEKYKFLQDLTYMQNQKTKKIKKHKAKHNKRRLIDIGINGQLPEKRKVQSVQKK